MGVGAPARAAARVPPRSLPIRTLELHHHLRLLLDQLCGAGPIPEGETRDPLRRYLCREP